MAEGSPGSSSSSGPSSGSRCSDIPSPPLIKPPTSEHDTITVTRAEPRYHSDHALHHSMSDNDPEPRMKYIADRFDPENKPIQPSPFLHRQSTQMHSSRYPVPNTESQSRYQLSPHHDQGHQSMSSLERVPVGSNRNLRFSVDMRPTYTDNLNVFGRSFFPAQSEYVSHEQQYPRYQPIRDTSKEGQVIKAICFDMDKVNKIGDGNIFKFNVKSSSLSPISVASVFNRRETDVRVVDRADLLFTVVILGQNASTSTEYVLVEGLLYVDQPYPKLHCVRIPSDGLSVNTLSNLIARELSVKKVAVCEDGRLLENETLIKNDSSVIRRVKAVHNTSMKITCLHQPAKNVESQFRLDTNTCANVANLRRAFHENFKDSLHRDDHHMLHFSLKGRLLDDAECIALLSWPHREGVVQVHVASPGIICVNLKFKEAVGKIKLPKSKSIVVNPNLSTATLRKEVSKQMGIDPKAVKLTLNNRRIEETNCLKEMGDLTNGCTLFAGIKKTKTIRVKDTGSQREAFISMYMLEQVHVLKGLIAARFGIDSLHVTLDYKGRRLVDNELLLNYPIKNQTEIKMRIYPNRINVHIYMAFNKTRSVLTIDHSDKTTVSELVRFSAITYKFDRKCARVQFCDRCLSKYSTLAEANIQNNSRVVLVHFDPPEMLEGDLIRVFSVHPDGQINQRLGAVNSGHLLHASKKVKPSDVRGYSNSVEQLPDGIRVKDDLVHAEEQVVSTEPMATGVFEDDKMEMGFTAAWLKALKQKFTKQANRLKQQKSSDAGVLRTGQKLPRPELSSSSESPSQISQRETPSLNFSELDYDSETGVKRPTEPTVETGSPPVEDYMTMTTTNTVNVTKRVKCIQSCCSDIQHMLGSNTGIEGNTEQQPCSCEEVENNSDTNYQRENEAVASNLDSVIREEVGNDIGKPGYGDSSGSTSDLYASIRRGVEFTLETESSDQEHGNMRVEAAAPRHYQGLDISRCQYLQRTRRRTRTEGEIDMQQPYRNLPHILTYPLLPQCRGGNEWLCTAGITINILVNVSKTIGRNWKRLARKLEIAETDIDNIEACNNNIDLQDTAYRMILFWKTSKGSSASKGVLVQALKDIEMVAAAENIETLFEGNATF